LSTESDTKKLLEYRGAMEARLAELEQEIIDARRAIAVIDKMIVAEGFRTPAVPPKAAAPKPPAGGPQDEAVPREGEATSITSKDGTVLGKLTVEGRSLVFRPQPEHGFTVEVPPFKSFLVDRVLANMSATDQERAANGEIAVEDTLSYDVREEDGRILEITVANYGGERRLREISSSLRWSFDKMYEKLRQG
jgi:hypothetical protein